MEAWTLAQMWTYRRMLRISGTARVKHFDILHRVNSDLADTYNPNYKIWPCDAQSEVFCYNLSKETLKVRGTLQKGLLVEKSS